MTVGRPLRVLLLEDSADDAELVMHHLEREGFDPRWTRVQDEPSYRNSLREGPWDLILSDHRLPGFDSIHAIKILHEAEMDVPFLIISSAIGEETAVAAMRAGAHDYIPKSSLGRLVPAIQRELREARSRREKRQTELSMRELHERLSEMYRRAEEASRAKSDFLATISHELRTPLNAILGWTELLTMNPKLDAEARKGLDSLTRNSKQLGRLVEDLMDSSKIMSGQIGLSPREIDLAQLLEASLEEIRPTAEAKGIKIDWRRPLDPIRIEADSQRLQQVFENLLSNAAKFTPPGGEITVFVDRTGNSAIVVVKDNGIGIRHDMLTRIFDRFIQNDGASTRRFGGLGLGLTIAKNIVDLHHGCISAESKGIDQGTTFTIRLPISQTKFMPATPAPARAVPVSHPAWERGHEKGTGPLRGLNVLVVDDEENILELFGTILELAGARCTRASSVKEAEAHLAKSVPDVIVSDIAMPDVDGYTFMQKLRSAKVMKNGRPVPTIAVTAHAGMESRERALASGFSMHLTKPVSSSELVSAVAAVTKRPALAG